jgi:integrase
LAEASAAPRALERIREQLLASIPDGAVVLDVGREDFTDTSDYVFCSRLGRPLNGSALRRRFKAAAAAAGLRVLRFHALRHGAGSLVARQADPRWVQGFLGHSKLATTERYLHAKARPEDIEVINRAFAERTVARTERRPGLPSKHPHEGSHPGGHGFESP